MFHKPKLKGFVTLFPLSPTTWGIRGGSDELWRIRMRDQQAFETFSVTLPYLNGTFTQDEIVAALAAKGIASSDVLQLLRQLQDVSLLEEAQAFGLSPAEEQRFEPQISFFSRYTAEGGARYQSRLRSSHVAVVGDGYLGRAVARSLASSGCGTITVLASDPAAGATIADASTTSDDWRPQWHVRPLDRSHLWSDDEADALPRLFIVAQEAEDPLLLQEMDALSKRHKAPWLLLRALESHVGWIGPLFVPDETACYRSLEARMRGNLSFFPEHDTFTRHLTEAGRPSAAVGMLHAFADILAGMAVTDAVKFITEFGMPATAGRFFTLNLMTWDIEVHDVLRVPRLGLDATTPSLFSWKDMPQDETEGHREGIYARRS